jgi:hypothetical protein
LNKYKKKSAGNRTTIEIYCDQREVLCKLGLTNRNINFCFAIVL